MRKRLRKKLAKLGRRADGLVIYFEWRAVEGGYVHRHWRHGEGPGPWSEPQAEVPFIHARYPDVPIYLHRLPVGFLDDRA